MNISEFERMLREGSTPQHFPPEEDKWLKLEKELGKKKRRGRVIALPKPLSWAVAASILLLISIGVYNRFNTSRTHGEMVRRKPQQPTTLLAREDTVVSQYKMQETIAVCSASNAAKQILSTRAPLRRRATPAIVETASQHDTVAVAKEEVSNRVEELPNTPEQPKQRRQNILPEQNDEPYAIASRGQKINFGVSALYGLSDVSKGQYRVSVDARRNLSKRVFANVQLIASTAKVSSTTSYEYQVISVGPPGIGGGGGTTIQQADADYSGSIYTLGLSPSIGFRVTKKVALSAGPDIQKALAGSLSLINRDAFLNQITNQSLVDETQQVAGLDFGLQSAAQVGVSRRLALTLLYRLGLTDYVERKDGAVRNSFMSVGLSYQFVR